MIKVKTLTKLAISEYIASECNLKKNLATKIVDSFFSSISASLEHKVDVKLSGFGNLSVKHKKARSGRNPKTLKEVLISERQVVVFKANRKLNNNINKNYS